MEVTPIIPVSKVNREKEYSRYQFYPNGNGWSVYRKGVFVGIYHDGFFEAVTGYENLAQFMYQALIRQIESARANAMLVNKQTLRIFGIHATA